MHYAFVNGKTVPRDEAAVSVLDRGFLFGDGVYDMIKMYEGIPLFLTSHLRRLRQSCDKAEIPFPVGLDEAVAAVVGKASGLTGSLYIQITRGAHVRHHLPPEDLPPTLVVFTQEYDFADEARVRKGYKTITVPDLRWKRCDIKTISLMGGIMAKLDAHRLGADEVMFLGENDEIHEGGSTNFFIVDEGTIRTHPLNNRALPGITRQVVMEEIEKAGYRLVEASPRLYNLADWDEAFLTGTLTGVMPVSHINGKKVGSGDFPVGMDLFRRLRAREDEERREAASV